MYYHSRRNSLSIYKQPTSNQTHRIQTNRSRRVQFTEKQNSQVINNGSNRQQNKNDTNDQYNNRNYSNKTNKAPLLNDMNIPHQPKRVINYQKYQKEDVQNCYDIKKTGIEEISYKYSHMRQEPKYSQMRQESARINYLPKRDAEQIVKNQIANSSYTKRETKNYSYLQQKDQQITKITQNKNQNRGLKAQMSRYQKQEKPKTKNINDYSIKKTVGRNEQSQPNTPRKSLKANSYVQKSEMLKRKMQSIENMTPRSSIYKNQQTAYDRSGVNGEEDSYVRIKNTKNQQNYLNIPQDKNNLPSKINNGKNNEIVNSRLIKEQTPLSYSSKQFQLSQKPKQNQYNNITHRRQNSVQGITRLSIQINQRLKSIIDKHSL